MSRKQSGCSKCEHVPAIAVAIASTSPSAATLKKLFSQMAHVAMSGRFLMSAAHILPAVDTDVIACVGIRCTWPRWMTSADGVGESSRLR